MLLYGSYRCQTKMCAETWNSWFVYILFGYLIQESLLLDWQVALLYWWNSKRCLIISTATDISMCRGQKCPEISYFITTRALQRQVSAACMSLKRVSFSVL